MEQLRAYIYLFRISSIYFNTRLARNIEICYYKFTNRSKMKRLRKTDHDDRIEKALKALLLLCTRR